MHLRRTLKLDVEATAVLLTCKRPYRIARHKLGPKGGKISAVSCAPVQRLSLSECVAPMLLSCYGACGTHDMKTIPASCPRCLPHQASLPGVYLVWLSSRLLPRRWIIFDLTGYVQVKLGRGNIWSPAGSECAIRIRSHSCARNTGSVSRLSMLGTSLHSTAITLAI